MHSVVGNNSCIVFGIVGGMFLGVGVGGTPPLKIIWLVFYSPSNIFPEHNFIVKDSGLVRVVKLNSIHRTCGNVPVVTWALILVTLLHLQHCF